MPILVLVMAIVTAISASGKSPPTVPCMVPTSCIDLRRCDSLLYLVHHGPQSLPRPEVLKFIRGKICGFAGDQPKVCCPPHVPTNLTKAPNNPSTHNKTITPKARICPPTLACVDLRTCSPLVHAVYMEKSLTQTVTTAIQEHLCGFQADAPKVCCQTTTPGLSRRQRADIMDDIFKMYNVFDDAPFDLLRRKRIPSDSTADELDIEIR